MKMKQTKLTVMTFLIGGLMTSGVAHSGVGYHKWCAIDYRINVVQNTTKPAFTALRTSNQASFNTMRTAMQQSIREASGLMVEGKRVLTMQESSNADQIAKGIADNTRVEMNVRHAMATQEKINEIAQEHSPMSVGLDPCQVVTDVQKVERSKKATRKVAEQLAQEVTARAGHYANRNEAMAKQLALHDLKYCTSDQVSSGLCEKVGTRAGKSLMASTLFKNAKQGDDDDQDKVAFINNMVGLPDNPIPSNLANTTLAIDYQDKKRQNDSLKSIAIHALNYLHAQSTEVETSATSEHLQTEKEHEQQKDGNKKKEQEKNPTPTNNPQPLIYGDSIAWGVLNGTNMKKLNAQGVARVGARPDEILGNIRKAKAGNPNYFTNRIVVISTGYSNNPSDTKNIQQLLDELKGARVYVMGVHQEFKKDKSKGTEMNNNLSKWASERGFSFQGGFMNTKDSAYVHPDGSFYNNFTIPTSLSSGLPTTPANNGTSSTTDFYASYSGLVKKDIERHFGGSEEYIKRKKYLAGATEKGVMIEIVKADSLLLRELADLYEAQKISLALTAGQTLALMKYVGMDTKVEQARQRAVRQKIDSFVMSDNLDEYNQYRKQAKAQVNQQSNKQQGYSHAGHNH